ncbi:MAG: hypothetical protein ACKOGH_16555 [Alphaproteobacteria bacterium]
MSAPRTPAFVPPSTLDPVVRALTYPYPAPPHDYLFRGGHAEPVAALLPRERNGRVPVLAIGSNRAPEQLQRKFADMPGAEIAVERVRLPGFDVVHSAHLSGYAALAATLLQAPGVVAEVCVTWLPPALMDRMHATEGIGTHYDFVAFDGIGIEVVAGGTMSSAFGYVCRMGALDFGDGPRGLSAVAATGRAHAPLGQREAQAHLVARLGLQLAVEDFVRQNAADPALRARREALLADGALHFGSPLARVVEDLQAPLSVGRRA